MVAAAAVVVVGGRGGDGGFVQGLGLGVLELGSRTKGCSCAFCASELFTLPRHRRNLEKGGAASGR